MPYSPLCWLRFQCERVDGKVFNCVRHLLPFPLSNDRLGLVKFTHAVLFGCLGVHLVRSWDVGLGAEVAVHVFFQSIAGDGRRAASCHSRAGVGCRVLGVGGGVIGDGGGAGGTTDDRNDTADPAADPANEPPQMVVAVVVGDESPPVVRECRDECDPSADHE